MDVCCIVDCVQGCFYTRFPSQQTLNGPVCNGLMSTELAKLIGTKLSSHMNHPSICGTMMAVFVLMLCRSIHSRVHYQTTQWPNTLSNGLGYDFVSWMIQFATNWGNSNRYICELQHPKVIPFLQGIPGTIFQQDNAHPHVAKTVRDFYAAISSLTCLVSGYVAYWARVGFG